MSSGLRAYVFLHPTPTHAGVEPLLVGAIQERQQGFVFGYAPDYLSRSDAVALDPLNLPLSDRQMPQARIPGVLLDATPDEWGRRLLGATHTRQPKNPLEWLLASRGSGVGALLFSASRTGLKPVREVPRWSDLKDLLGAVRAVEHHAAVVNPELILLLEYGSSMGGARPKVTLHDQGADWLVKLGRESDAFDEVRAEYASLQLARSVGLRVPASRLETVEGQSVLLVRRFDRPAPGLRTHYISAHALMNLEKMRPSDLLGQVSYAGLAEISRKVSAAPRQEQEEWFRRAVFNVMLGNTDDHLRNHGWLQEGSLLRLSPMFDVLPQPKQQSQHAIGVGREGRLSSLANVFSGHEAFGLNDAQARCIIEEVREGMSHAPEAFRAAGMAEVEVRMLSDITGRLLTEALPGPRRRPRP